MKYPIKVPTLVDIEPAQLACEEVDPPPSTIRFLSLLSEELRPNPYILPRDSQGLLIDSLQTLVVTFKLGDPNASLLSLIMQESPIQTHFPNPNDLANLPEPTGTHVSRLFSMLHYTPSLSYIRSSLKLFDGGTWPQL